MQHEPLQFLDWVLEEDLANEESKGEEETEPEASKPKKAPKGEKREVEEVFQDLLETGDEESMSEEELEETRKVVEEAE